MRWYTVRASDPNACTYVRLLAAFVVRSSPINACKPIEAQKHHNTTKHMENEDARQTRTSANSLKSDSGEFFAMYVRHCVARFLVTEARRQQRAQSQAQSHTQESYKTTTQYGIYSA